MPYVLCGVSTRARPAQPADALAPRAGRSVPGGDLAAVAGQQRRTDARLAGLHLLRRRAADRSAYPVPAGLGCLLPDRDPVAADRTRGPLGRLPPAAVLPGRRRPRHGLAVVARCVATGLAAAASLPRPLADLL